MMNKWNDQVFFQYIVDVILEIYKIGDIKAFSWVELPEKNKDIKSYDQIMFFAVYLSVFVSR